MNEWMEKRQEKVLQRWTVWSRDLPNCFFYNAVCVCVCNSLWLCICFSDFCYSQGLISHVAENTLLQPPSSHSAESWDVLQFWFLFAPVFHVMTETRFDDIDTTMLNLGGRRKKRDL